MRFFLLTAAFILCLPFAQEVAASKQEMFSCELAGVSATYTRAGIGAVISAGAKCQPLQEKKTATCVIGNIAQQYARVEVETVFQEHPDAVCMHDGGVTVKADKVVIGQKQAINTSLRVYFASNSTKIGYQSDIDIAKFADQFADSQSWLTITAYTDKSGSKAYNLKLSMQRAEKVKARLLYHGVSPREIIAVSALGETAAKNMGRVVVVRAYR